MIGDRCITMYSIGASILKAAAKALRLSWQIFVMVTVVLIVPLEL